jgi:hypothetical protein
MITFSSRWVPNELMDEHNKYMCLDICSCHLACYREESDSFLQQIIAGDETWVYHCQPETKHKSMQFKHPSSPVAKKFKAQPSTGKLMLTIFWDSQGPILKTYPEQGTAVTRTAYCDMLHRGPKHAIHSKREGDYQRASCCCTTVHDAILRPTC